MRNIEQLNIEREDPILDQDDEKEATKEERINTESFLADLKERGSKFFDSEGVKKGLLEKGIEHEDVQVATDLMSCIASINESLGIKEDLSLNFSISQNEFGDVAGFSSSDKEKDEIREENLSSPSLFINLEEDISPSSNEAIISSAIFL